ncbi:unnamed protein product, partial [Durusdinium trenchii]
LAVSQCLQRCEQEEGCLGVIYGQVEGPRRVELRCFLAGVGEDDVLMEYSCSSPGCVSRVSSRALLELSQTLQCWQKRWQRCEDPGEPPVEEDRESEERLASILSELRSKLKSLPAMSSTARGVFRLHFRHVLVILGGVCRLLGRAADQADATVQRCLHAAQATLEGPTGGGAWILLVPIGLGLLGQHLRSCFVQRWEKLQELKAAEKVSYADLVFPDCHDFVTSGPHPVPMLVSSGLMPESPDSPQVCEMLELPPARGRTEARRRAMTPPRPRSLLPVFKARHEDDHSSDPEQEVPPHVSHWRELEKIKKADRPKVRAKDEALIERPKQRAAQPHPSLELLRGVVARLYYSQITAGLYLATMVLAALLLCITLGMETPLRDAPRALLFLEGIITLSLVVEVILRAIVQGRNYLKSWWNAVDGSLAVLSSGLFFFAAPRAAGEAQKEDVELSQSLVMARVIFQFVRVLRIASLARRASTARGPDVSFANVTEMLEFTDLEDFDFTLLKQEIQDQHRKDDFGL